LGTLLNSIILSNIQYGYILIEATGIADPGEIIQMFSGKRVQKYFKLDAVIGLVDAVLFSKQSNRFDEISRQVAQSDIVLVNKTDLVRSSQVTDVIHKIRSINPFARLEKSTFAHTENIPILFSGAFDPSRIEKSIVDFTSLSMAKPEIPIKHAIQTLSYTIPGDLDMARLSEWLEQFLYKNAESILRIKGVLSIADMKHKIILQSVGDNFQVLQGTVWESSKNRTSHLVFIGSKLDGKAIEKNLYSLTTAKNKASHL
jgi:G3E family GTPase